MAHLAEREILLTEYRRLTRLELPAAAARHRWHLRYDHCFMRIILDDLFGDCWYRHLDRRKGSAESQLAVAQLRRAVETARALLRDGEPGLRALDDRSLAWRGKRRAGSRHGGAGA